MALEKKSKTLTEQMRQYMLARSPQVTPNNPTSSGWSASKIREYQWKPSDILFTYLDGVEGNLVAYVNEMITFGNTNETAINDETSRAKSAESTLQSKINSEANTRLVNDKELQTNIDSESTRAVAKENQLDKKIGTTKSDIIGNSEDDKSVDTINGARAYADYQAANAKTYAKEYTDGRETAIRKDVTTNANDITALRARATKDEALIDTKMTQSSFVGSDGKILGTKLPSYVDDVLEYSSKLNFPKSGETGKIYVATDNNRQYRWSGSQYIQISESLALGYTQETAYSGYEGKQNRESIDSLKTRVTSVENKASANETDIAKKQDKLVSGTNLATINGYDLTKGGNIKVVTELGQIDSALNSTSENAIQNKAVVAGISATDMVNSKNYVPTLEARSDGLYLVFKTV